MTTLLRIWHRWQAWRYLCKSGDNCFNYWLREGYWLLYLWHSEKWKEFDKYERKSKL